MAVPELAIPAGTAHRRRRVGAVLRNWLAAKYRPLLQRMRGEMPVALMIKRGLTVGEGAYINPTAHLDPDFLWLISIGEDSVLANRVMLIAHDGSTRQWCGYIRIGRIDIGRRVYVGAGAIVLPGVSIGDDAIVGAGALVRSDVPAGVVVAGVPAVTVGTTAEFAERHRDRLRTRPVYPSAGFSGYDYVTPANIGRVREDLRDGTGYVA